MDMDWNTFQKYFAAYRKDLQSEGTKIVEDCINYALSFHVMGTKPKHVVNEAYHYYKKNKES